MEHTLSSAGYKFPNVPAQPTNPQDPLPITAWAELPFNPVWVEHLLAREKNKSFYLAVQEQRSEMFWSLERKTVNRERKGTSGEEEETFTCQVQVEAKARK